MAQQNREWIIIIEACDLIEYIFRSVRDDEYITSWRDGLGISIEIVADIKHKAKDIIKCDEIIDQIITVE